jgi:anaerobic magnesium-protoporphyrin IX monomethyl ester cyclase
MSHALLLQPPPGDLTGPPATFAYLKAYVAQLSGLDVQVQDLGIDAFDYLRQPQQIDLLIKKADILRQQLEAKGALRGIEKRWYGLLLMAKGFGLQPDKITAAVAGLKTPQRFNDYPLYKTDCGVIDAFFRTLRAVAYPTMVTPTHYASAHELKSMDAVWLHRDAELNPYQSYYEAVLFPQIVQAGPSVIGIAMETAAQSTQALVLGQLLKERFKDIHVTMGGRYLTQWILLMDDDLLRALFTATDSVICGDMEECFSSLLSRSVQGHHLGGIPNLIHRDAPGGEIQMFASLIFSDLKRLPAPDFSDLDLSTYLVPEPVLPYRLTQGCYWQHCGFCQNRIGNYHPRPYQAVPADKAIAELETLTTTYGANHFHFCGEVIKPADLSRFCDAKIASQLPFLWNTTLRAEKEFTRDFCRRLRRAGFNAAVIGMHSGCQPTLDRMETGIDAAVIGQTLLHLYEAGVATQVSGLLGFPGESEIDAHQSIEFIRHHMDVISTFDMQLLRVRPGSAMHNDPGAFGVDLISYQHNPLMTPEPIWKSSRRIGLSAVSRLLERLDRLETATCLSNDKPYAGAINTNHSFLYFKQGPDIFKRIRNHEDIDHRRLHLTFGIDDRHRPVGEVQKGVPYFCSPHIIYRSPYLHERRHFGTSGPQDSRPLTAGHGWDYLLDPINVPLNIDWEEQQLLNAIDGQHDIETILAPFDAAEADKLRMFLVRLVLSGVVALSDGEKHSPLADKTASMD